MKKTMMLLACVLLPLPAFAYVGPGLGLGTIGVVLGVLFSLFMAMVAIVWYPIKRLWKKVRGKQTVER